MCGNVDDKNEIKIFSVFKTINMAAQYKEAAMNVLIVGPGQTLPVTLKHALVPVVHMHSVSLYLRKSPLISVATNGVLQHVWCDALERLRLVAASAPVTVDTWAINTKVPSSAEFVRYVRMHPARCKLYCASTGTVRQITDLNAYDQRSMKAVLCGAGLAGVSRSTMIAEYDGAYTDLLLLQRQGQVFATAERVWNLPPLPFQLRLTAAPESSSTMPPT
jgi:hypothetical protein